MLHPKLQPSLIQLEAELSHLQRSRVRPPNHLIQGRRAWSEFFYVVWCHRGRTRDERTKKPSAHGPAFAASDVKYLLLQRRSFRPPSLLLLFAWYLPLVLCVMFRQRTYAIHCCFGFGGGRFCLSRPGLFLDIRLSCHATSPG